MAALKQTIDIRTATGGTEYTRLLTITETSTPPGDITGDTVQLSLGSYSSPGAWLAPDVDQSPADNERTVALLIGDTLKPAAGTYYLWSRVTDAPELVPRRHFAITILADS